MSLISNISRGPYQRISWIAAIGFGAVGIGALTIWLSQRWKPASAQILDSLRRFSHQSFVATANKHGCVPIFWGNKKYEILPSRGEFFQAYFSNRDKMHPTCIYPDDYQINNTFSEAIILSLQCERIMDTLKKEGIEAFLDAVCFADTFKCGRMLENLRTYFLVDLLYDKEISLKTVDELINVFQGRGLDDFTKSLLCYTVFQHDNLTPLSEGEFQRLFKKPSPRYKEELENNFPCCMQDILRKNISILLSLIKQEETLKFLRMNLAPASFNWLFDRMRNLPDFLNAGGSLNELLNMEEPSRLRLLENSSHLAEFIRQGGKLIDLYPAHSGIITRILENSDKLEAFKKIGGTIEKLYTVKSSCSIELIFEHLDKIPFYLEQGGTWDALYAIEPTALEYLLRFSANIPDFIAAGGKLSDLYYLPKERNTVEGAKVGPLLELAKNLRQWTTLGGTLPQLYEGNVDTGIVRTVLENVDRLKNYMNKGGTLDRLLELDYWRIIQALQV